MITFSTSWYKIKKAKFGKSRYEKWFSNLLLNVKNFYLIIYTDEDSKNMLLPYIGENKNIKIIILPKEEFYNYRYKEKWENNHKKNKSLRKITSWQLNMLWAEKIHFVKKTIQNNYFNTDWFGWVDIGYFRGSDIDSPIEEIKNWPNHSKIKDLNKDKIYYANVSENRKNFKKLIKHVKNVNKKGLPKTPIPESQVSIAGGFFLIYKDKIDWWFNTFDKKLQLYFNNNYLVKDDQMIILNCVVENFDKFNLCYEENPKYDNWFMFQRFLL